jgi:hypothetical protein
MPQVDGTCFGKPDANEDDAAAAVASAPVDNAPPPLPSFLAISEAGKFLYRTLCLTRGTDLTKKSTNGMPS